MPPVTVETRLSNNAEWGTDYLNRTGTAKSNMYDNRPEETKYIYTDDDSQGKQLSGQNNYSIKFAKGEVPPVHGFWSLTLYDAAHLFYPKGLNRYSLGTNNADGSLTLYAGSKDKESNWLPAPKHLNPGRPCPMDDRASLPRLKAPGLLLRGF